MFLLDWLFNKWRSRQVFVEQEKHKACEKVAYLLWESDGKPRDSETKYYLEACKRLSGVRWQFYKLNQAFIWVEKKIIEPLDFWSDRANIFSFVSKLSPILEAIGVLAIPVVIFYFENQREERQLKFEENLILVQTEVRHQQAVRDYLSQVTTIHLETDEGKKIKDDKELKTLLEATTLALFDELSVSEGSLSSSREPRMNIDWEIIQRDRKRQVVKFLSGLGWLNGLKEEEPLLSLRESNLIGANLWGADLSGADLSGADLSESNLIGADLSVANLSCADLLNSKICANIIGADLSVANLSGADLSGADLSESNLIGADLSDADLSGADLNGANLTDAEKLTPIRIKSACNWEKAIYKSQWNSEKRLSEVIEPDNTNFIEELKKDKASDPKEPPDCYIYRNSKN